MSKIAIVGFHNLHLMQFLYKYTNILDEHNIEYDVLYWNRDGIEYEKKFRGGSICFNYPTSNYISKCKKLRGYLKARKFFIDTIKRNKYDKVILLTTQTAVALSSLVLRKYKNAYIYDYRDITMEKIPVYKTLVKKLIADSTFTAISSPGFIPVLGYDDTQKYVVSHNCTKLVYNHHERSKKLPIRIAFWGIVRQIDYQKRICDFWGNNKYFDLYYYGEGATDVLRSYCQASEYENIHFFGRYFTEEIPGFAKNTDILMNLYENDGKQEYALTVKMYDGIRYGLPMLVMKDSYMDSYIGESNFKYAFSFSDTDLNAIRNWYMNLDENNIEMSQRKMIEVISKDDDMFERNLIRFSLAEEADSGNL